MTSLFPIKALADGRVMLNLACGTRMSQGWNNLDFSPYAWLAHHKTMANILRGCGVLSESRYQKLSAVDPDIIHWDIRNGIPFDDETFDVLYHSHFLEHLDRDLALVFLKECLRTLKKGGTIRVVVPDLQFIINRYTRAIVQLQTGDQRVLSDHEQALHDLFDQMVRKEPLGTSQQSKLIRLGERLVRGDSSNIGEAHRWMYDRYNLTSCLLSVGFRHVEYLSSCSSTIEGWRGFSLDTQVDGSEYKPGSLYVEASK